MSDVILDDTDIAKLGRFASVLVPRTETMPAAADLEQFAALLRLAVKACGYPDAEVRAALDAVPADADWERVKAFATARAARFNIAATLCSGAYFMSPVVLEKLRYPLERRHPAGPEEFADEYETGILDPVIERGQRWRDPR